MDSGAKLYSSWNQLLMLDIVDNEERLIQLQRLEGLDAWIREFMCFHWTSASRIGDGWWQLRSIFCSLGGKFHGQVGHFDIDHHKGKLPASFVLSSKGDILYLFLRLHFRALSLERKRVPGSGPGGKVNLVSSQTRHHWSWKSTARQSWAVQLAQLLLSHVPSFGRCEAQGVNVFCKIGTWCCYAKAKP